jgi:hypothetical protein
MDQCEEMIAAFENKETIVFLMFLESGRRKAIPHHFQMTERECQIFQNECFRFRKWNRLLQACNETVF